ncbi:hypothetical protein TMatcc_008696 [Talaromyces marneffei ATCC 18224]|uniref:Apple domain-containing protein n=2 Tax=Talaromyces marneffei TaxID=37727 RepID=B6QLA3_TALMQ|nr:uncharacterized protein EYB26_008021 [Talaromyces marneffei]EEA21880.1 conserved hypothetical protein [Talaromyces marneffei ATCC 18224]KAE8550649.1 hypothetical protein EYB25_006877 [Talaromyces marneffei]QGA20319.1 hypothetical protein EYB26_008021 [Talaromyces marneffei]
MVLLIALAAGFLLDQVSANAPLARTPLASTPVPAQPSIVCRTKLGTASVAVIPTFTVTHTSHDTHPVVVYSTVQDTVTVTPTATWLSFTDYATITVTTTAGTITDTFSTTSTKYTTVTDTLTLPTVTATSLSTISVLSTATSTISTVAGFTPIADTMATPTGLKRSLSEDPEDSDDSEDSCPNWDDDYQYTTAVECVATAVVKTTTTSTVIGSPATATAAEPTRTTTVTSTVTSSSTVLPADASTTLSYSTLSTVTETSTARAVTSTVTSSTTVTTGVTTTSLYAACATNNIASSPLSSDFGSQAGQYIDVVTFSNIPGQDFVVASVSSPYDCCVACQQNPACAFTYSFAYNPSYCHIVLTNSCSSKTHGTAGTTSVANGAMILSNGPCGRILLQ